ncbi:uncharacterized protein LOC144119126 [Amblyomma americanum]
MQGSHPRPQKSPQPNNPGEGSTPGTYYTAPEGYMLPTPGEPFPGPGGGPGTPAALRRASEHSFAACAPLLQRPAQQASAAHHAGTPADLFAPTCPVIWIQPFEEAATAEVVTLADGTKTSPGWAPTSWKEKRTALTSHRSSHAVIACIELCLAFTIIVLIGMLLLFIFVTSGAWPTRHEPTATLRIETVPDEPGSLKPFVAVRGSVYSRPTGESSDMSAHISALVTNDARTDGNISTKPPL